ncbi:hypothetical protein [Clostridium tyrobutyricum]|uniref:hypothetical protein n=1 Tax=Clostridium tyrobutyricum TaxID=1519 RepID=UPI001C38DFCE|nr:hypothetical protein [Clostridium tyrobutyricum]MBV4424282.1 hypothetical protein [Clostridium tyrobutyricum]
MTFKESVAYSKDLVNGTKIEVIKKKLIMPFTGTATVKLYDSLTGRQTYEAKSENRISAAFGNIAYLDTFYYPMLDNAQDYLLKDVYTTYPFRVMVLTTGSTPEDPYDYWTWGDIVGYADAWYTYSGSDILKGTVNKGEWTRSTGLKHFVIDFPTHAANGTFKSIYWTGGASDYSEAQPPVINKIHLKDSIVSGTSSSSLSKSNLCVDETNLYRLISGSKTIMVYDKVTEERKDDITLSISAKAIAYDGMNFWLLLSDGAFKKTDKNFSIIASYTKSAVLPGDLVYSIDYTDIAVTANYIFITYSGCTDTSGSSSKYKNCIAKYNKDGTFVNKADVFTGTSYDGYITEIPNNKLWIMIYGNRCIQVNEDLSVYGSTDLTSCYYYSVCWDEARQSLFAYSSTNYGLIAEYYVVPAAAHTLLPEPITKTPTNTMKIQYDFNCEYVNPLDMPPH